MFKTKFNLKVAAVSAFALANLIPGMATNAQADDTAPNTQATNNAATSGITVHIARSYYREGFGISQPVQNIQGCYNALASTAANSAPDSMSSGLEMMCLNKNGEILATAICRPKTVSWSSNDSYFSCVDTTAETRKKFFPITPEALKRGPVKGPVWKWK